MVEKIKTDRMKGRKIIPLRVEIKEKCDRRVIT